MKISDLAKKLKIPPKQLLIQVVKLGVSAKSTQSIIPEDAIDKIISALAKKKIAANTESVGKKKSAPDKKVKKPSPAVKPAPKKKTAAAKPKQASDSPKKPKTAKKQKPQADEKKEALFKGDAIKKPASGVITKKSETAAIAKKPEAKQEPEGIADKIPGQETAQASLRPVFAKTIQVRFPVSVKDLAQKMSIGPSLVIKALIGMKIFATINQMIDEASAQAVAEKFSYNLERLPTAEEEAINIHEEEAKDERNLLPRPPVVTFMGHVDHGKTSLLDYIRKTKVTDQEKGGITQHIGAYEVMLNKGKITFLDTPGHEAFTAMRARGANATDIVVLVVAADDGIMPQTTEALDHARAAGVPIIVAINKIDKPNVDIERVKKQLSEVDLLPEDWGGKTVAIGVSAKTGAGVDELLEMMLLEAEMLELKANPNKPAKGVVIEAKVSKGGGPIATVLVQAGTLNQGDIVIAGPYCGKIRALINDRLHRVDKAGPSMPVEILGLSGAPQAGETFMVISDEKTAKQICDKRQQKLKEQDAGPSARRITLEDLYSEIKQGKIKELNVILKADVRGSLEAIVDSLNKLSTSAITLNIIHKGVGEVNESDILLAAASNAIIIGFHVRKTPEAEKAGRAEHVDVRLYGIIYEAVSDIKAAMEGLLEPHIKETVTAKVLIRQVFKVSKAGIIAGCFVQKGKVVRNSECRLMRAGQQVHRGKISSLKRFKDDVREVAEGFECGISMDNFKDMQPGDIFEVLAIEKIARKL